MKRRLEDRIRELCSRAVNARGEDEVPQAVAELGAALHEHVERFKRKAVVKLVRKDKGFEERRAA